MKNIGRTLIGMLTAVSMAFTITAAPVMSVSASAEETGIDYIYDENFDFSPYGEPFLPTGDALEPEGQEVPPEEVERICEEIEERGGDEYVQDDLDLASASYYSYSSRYFYDNVLANNTEKAFYDKMDSACRAVLNSTSDYTDVVKYSNGSVAKRIASVEYTGISKDRASLIYTMFKFSNPQYYFLSNSHGYGTRTSGSNTKNYLYLQFMVANGYDFSIYLNNRKTAQDALNALTESWMADIDLIASDYEKELEISKRVIEYLTYDNDSVDGSHEELQKFNQSIISGVLRKTTVCAGYTHLTSYFLNAAGIESFYINSNGHAWNLVKLYGNWYELDNTWADQDKGTNPHIWEIWRNKSHKTFLDYDSQRGKTGSHTYKSMWSGVALPATYYDTVQLPAPVDPGSVTLDKTELELEIGSTFTLNATVLPSYSSDKSVTWSSDKTGIAKVEGGVVTAIAEGTAIITASTFNGKSAVCTVTVKPVEASGVELNKSEISLRKGDSFVLTAAVTPSNTTNKTVKWISSDLNVATVEQDGTVTAVGGGTANISAVTPNGKEGVCKVSVIVDVNGIMLNKTELALDSGKTFKLTAEISPEDATDKTITWSSADEKIAAVSTDGTVKAKLPGTVKITAKTSNNKTAECTVTVKLALPDEGKGDINGDTNIDNDDYELLVLVIIMKSDASGPEYDMDTDTYVNGKDLILLRRKLYGMIS